MYVWRLNERDRLVLFRMSVMAQQVQPEWKMLLEKQDHEILQVMIQHWNVSEARGDVRRGQTLAFEQNYLLLWLRIPSDTPCAAGRSASSSKSLPCTHTHGYWSSCTSLLRSDLKNTSRMADSHRCSLRTRCRILRRTAGTRYAACLCSASADGNLEGSGRTSRSCRREACVGTWSHFAHFEQSPRMLCCCIALKRWG